MLSAFKRFFLSVFFVTCLGCSFLPTPVNAETDFGRVSLAAADLLQRNHYTQREFDDVTSKELLENYLNFLDFSHLYFTQEDVDEFHKNYATELDDRVLLHDVSPAIEIYEAYEARVKERFAKVKEILANETFEFSSDRTINRSRKDVPWPANKEAADQVWSDILENNLLEEELSDIAKTEAEEEKEKKRAEKIAAGEEVEDEQEETEDSDEDKTPVERILKRYEQVLTDLADTDEEEIVNHFLSSLAHTYDPHSDYFSQSELEQFEISMKNELVGIGALLSKDEGGAAEIQGLVVGGPADKGGELAPFDRIVGVAQGLEGEMVDVTLMKLQNIVKIIRGKKGSDVRLEVNPAEAADPGITTEIIIRRDTVKLKDKLANAELLEIPKSGDPQTTRRIGWINLSSFYADMQRGGTTATTKDIQRLVKRLMKEGIEGLILDLRGNPGGSLEEAINLTGLFIKNGPVVQQKDTFERTSYRSSRSGRLYGGPLVVLQDRQSASASEILAAALQDYQRAVIVGESSSFGKGTVQTIMEVGNNMGRFSAKDRAGALKVTIQKFYRIAGGSTQLKGVVPDLIFPSIRDALDIGEDALDNPLAYDEIEPRQYSPSEVAPLPISDLRARFESRIEGNPEFQYSIEDRDRLKKRIDDNQISINLDTRISERTANKERLEARKAERRARNESIEADGKTDIYKIYKLNLDNVDQEELVSAEDFSAEDSTGMRMGDKKDGDEEDENDGFPYDIEPQKLEALNILQDLIDLSAKDRTAKASENKTQGG